MYVKGEGWRIDGFDFYFTTPTPDFIQCLTDRGTILYGIAWCPQCQQQVKLLDPAANKLHIVDCDAQSETCSQANVYGYPIWQFPDGSKASGVQDLSTLTRKTGCIP